MTQISIALVLFLTMSAHTCNKKTAEAAGNGDAGAGMANLATMTDTKLTPAERETKMRQIFGLS